MSYLLQVLEDDENEHQYQIVTMIRTGVEDIHMVPVLPDLYFTSMTEAAQMIHMLNGGSGMKTIEAMIDKNT